MCHYLTFSKLHDSLILELPLSGFCLHESVCAESCFSQFIHGAKEKNICDNFKEIPLTEMMSD